MVLQCLNWPDPSGTFQTVLQKEGFAHVVW